MSYFGRASPKDKGPWTVFYSVCTHSEIMWLGIETVDKCVFVLKLKPDIQYTYQNEYISRALGFRGWGGGGGWGFLFHFESKSYA